MKLSRFLLFAALITSFSLLYVYQQTEIFRLAYIGQKKRVVSEDLLDKNTLLRYNIAKTASLIEISSRISQDRDFAMPESCRLVRVISSGKSVQLVQGLAEKQTLLSRIFSIKRQAEAKTINP